MFVTACAGNPLFCINAFLFYSTEKCTYFPFFFPHRSYFSSDSYYCSTFDFLINLPYLKCFTTPFLSGIFWLSHVMLSLFPGDNQPLKKKRKRYIMWINYSLTTGKDLKNQCVSHSRCQLRKDHKSVSTFLVFNRIVFRRKQQTRSMCSLILVVAASKDSNVLACILMVLFRYFIINILS